MPALAGTTVEGTATEGTIAEAPTAEGAVADGHKRSAPADPLQTTEDITLDAKGRKLVRDCYDGLECAEELPRSKAMFNSRFLTAARKPWLHIACVGHKKWERLFCALCMRTHEPPEKKGRDVFWRGQARTDEDKLKVHEQSKLHLEAVASAKDTAYSKLIESFTIQLSSMKASVLHKMYDVYFIAKENVSLMKHRSFTFLSQLHGVPSSLKYSNKDMCREYIECISAVLFNKQVDRIKASPVFGIAIDESTDISLEKHCVVYVKYIHNAVSVDSPRKTTSKGNSGTD